MLFNQYYWLATIFRTAAISCYIKGGAGSLQATTQHSRAVPWWRTSTVLQRDCEWRTRASFPVLHVAIGEMHAFTHQTCSLFFFFCVLHCLEASLYRWKAEWQALPMSAGASSDVFLLGCIGRCFGAWQGEPRTIITNARMAVAYSDKPVCAISIIVSYYHHTTFPVYLCSKHWSNISYDTLSVLWC